MPGKADKDWKGAYRSNEMRIKVAHTSPPAHAYGEGGPESNSGVEGPDTLPKSDRRASRREDD